MKHPCSTFLEPRSWRVAFGLAFALALSASGPLAQSTTAFIPGERWSVDPPSGATWIPRGCAFTAHGELVWAATSGAQPEAFLSSTVEVPDPVLERALDFSGALGAILVAAGPRPDQLYTLHQLAIPGEVTRRTIVRRYDAEHAALGNGFAPRFNYDLGALVNAPAHLALSEDGSVLIAAVYDAARGEVQVDLLDPFTGQLVVRVHFPGSALRRVELSGDGQRLALCAGNTLLVLDPTGSVLFETDLPGSSAVFAFSYDGLTFAYGDGGAVYVHQDLGLGYGASTKIPGAVDDVAADVKLSHDGATLAIAWWNSLVYSEAGLDVFALPALTLLNKLRQAGGSLALQNFPAALDMTPDGRRILLGLWGSSDASPEILLVERGQAGVVYDVDLPGSPYDLDLDSSGSRIVAASKDAHANLFSTSGRLQLFETGERDLVMMDVPKPGQVLRFLALLSQPAPTWILVGFEGDGPLAFPSFYEGLFWLDPARTILPLTTGNLGGNQVRATIQVPAGVLMIGLEVAAQAWIATPTGPKLSETVVRPVVL